MANLVMVKLASPGHGIAGGSQGVFHGKAILATELGVASPRVVKQSGKSKRQTVCWASQPFSSILVSKYFRCRSSFCTSLERQAPTQNRFWYHRDRAKRFLVLRARGAGQEICLRAPRAAEAGRRRVLLR